MHNRIKELRKQLGLSQSEFGAKIGVKQTSIAGYETGARVPLDAIVSAICREYRVNELWLRTGEGEPFVQVDEDQAFLDAIADITISNTRRAAQIRKILRIYWDLPDEAKDLIDKFVKEITDECAE